MKDRWSYPFTTARERFLLSEEQLAQLNAVREKGDELVAKANSASTPRCMEKSYIERANVFYDMADMLEKQFGIS